MQAEELVRIGPGSHGPPARGAGEALEFSDRVLVRVLGVDALALGKGKGAAQHAHGLPRKAHEIHLNAALRLVINSVVGEVSEVEIAIELAVDASEQVE